MVAARSGIRLLRCCQTHPSIPARIAWWQFPSPQSGSRTCIEQIAGQNAWRIVRLRRDRQLARSIRRRLPDPRRTSWKSLHDLRNRDVAAGHLARTPGCRAKLAMSFRSASNGRMMIVTQFLRLRGIRRYAGPVPDGNRLAFAISPWVRPRRRAFSVLMMGAHNLGSELAPIILESRSRLRICHDRPCASSDNPPQAPAGSGPKKRASIFAPTTRAQERISKPCCWRRDILHRRSSSANPYGLHQFDLTVILYINQNLTIGRTVESSAE